MASERGSAGEHVGCRKRASSDLQFAARGQRAAVCSSQHTRQVQVQGGACNDTAHKVTHAFQHVRGAAYDGCPHNPRRAMDICSICIEVHDPLAPVGAEGHDVI